MDVLNILDRIDQGAQLTVEERAFLRSAQGATAGVQAAAEENRPDIERAVERIAGLVGDAVQRSLADLPALRTVNPAGPPPEQAQLTARQMFNGLVRGIRKGVPMEELVAKGMTIGTDADGGYLVPTTLGTEIVRYINEYGVARQFATVISNAPAVIQLNTRDTGMTAYWVNEASQITASKPTYAQAEVTPKKLAVLSDAISNELLQDANVDIFNEIGIEAAEAMAYEEDVQMFTGTGTPWTGIINTSTLEAKTVNGAIEQLTYNDLAGVSLAVAGTRLIGARWFMHRSVYEIVKKIKTTDGVPLYASPVNGAEGTIDGYPYTLCEAMPAASTITAGKPFAILGNLNNVRIYDRSMLSVKVLTEGTANSVNLGETDQVAVRFIQRLGMIVRRPKALVVMKLAA